MQKQLVRLFFDKNNRQGLDDVIAVCINLHDFKTCDEPKLLQLTKPAPRKQMPFDGLYEVLANGGARKLSSSLK